MTIITGVSFVLRVLRVLRGKRTIGVGLHPSAGTVFNCLPREDIMYLSRVVKIPNLKMLAKQRKGLSGSGLKVMFSSNCCHVVR